MKKIDFMRRYLEERLLRWKGKKGRKPLILKGARQVGKTYLLKAFGEKQFSKTHYLNFERDKGLSKIFEKDLNPKRIVAEISFHLDETVDLAGDLIIFDEIGYCPKALTSLKYFAEETPEAHLCAAGSLLGLQVGSESFPVGKVEFENLYPLCFEEFLSGTGDERSFEFLQRLKIDESIPEIVHSHLWEQWKRYMIVGGLPEVVSAYGKEREREGEYQAFQNVRKRQLDLVNTYYADMAKHAGKTNAMHIERVWSHIPSVLAQTQDGSAPKFKFKGVIPELNRYNQFAGPIDWLNAAGLIIKVLITHRGELPFSAFTKENSLKLYFFDVGMLGAVSGLSPKMILDYDYKTYKGYMAENFVAQEFLCRDSSPLYGWREGHAEVEFLKEAGSQILPIEIKSGWVTQAKSLWAFAKKYNPPYRTVMSAKNLLFDRENRIYHCPLYLAYRFPPHVTDIPI